MKNVILSVCLAALLLGTPALAIAPAEPLSNPEMQRIFNADQADRSAHALSAISKDRGQRDAARREQTRRLLADGQLQTGEDYLGAAFVFQHGSGDDFLLAHTLAVIATKKGAQRGPWIAAATLDRYLGYIGRKQIYGTQTFASEAGITKEPFDRDLIGDGLRRELGIPDLATQDRTFEAEKAKGNPAVAPVAATLPASGSEEFRCDTGPIERIFVRLTWHILSCNTGGLVATGGDASRPDILLINLTEGKVTVFAQSRANEEEIAVVSAAFRSMTPAQFADIVAQTKSAKK